MRLRLVYGLWRDLMPSALAWAMGTDALVRVVRLLLMRSELVPFVGGLWWVEG